MMKILFSNDTTNMLHPTVGAPYGGEPGRFDADKMKASVDEAASASVDVHLLQPGFSWIPWYNSRLYTREDHAAWFAHRFPGKRPDPVTRYRLDGGDIVGDIVGRCIDDSPAQS